MPISKIKGSVISDSSIDSVRLDDGSIVSVDIADNAVSESKIVTGAVTETKLGTDAVTETKILDGSVTETKLGTDSVTEAKIADNAVTENKLGTDVQGRMDQVDSAMGFKNRIIGGNFSTNPWQRGTSFTGPVNVDYTADRFQVSKVGVGVFDIDKTADAPTVAEAGVFTQHCFHADVTTIDSSLAASDLYAIQHVVEGYNSLDFGFGQSGTRYVTLSFWHKHTVTGTYSVSFVNSARDRSYVAEYTQSTTNTWEKAELTIPVDTSGTWLYDNNVGLRLYFAMAIGSIYAGAAGSWSANDYRGSTNQVNALATLGNDFKIALVQLEAGDKATRFETRSVGQELALCQRYYQQFSVFSSSFGAFQSYYGGNNAVCPQHNLITVMRDRPNPTIINSSVEYYSYGGVWTSTTLSIAARDNFYYDITCTTDGDGRGKLLRNGSSGNANDPIVQFSAEL